MSLTPRIDTIESDNTSQSSDISTLDSRVDAMEEPGGGPLLATNSVAGAGFVSGEYVDFDVASGADCQIFQYMLP